METPDILICQWPASLYLDKKRQWIYGNLAIHSDNVSFTANSAHENSILVIPFEDFADVKKSRTGLVFGAIYIVKRNSEKIWISSLADREGVFGALKHFWRTQLVPESKSEALNVGAKTQRGVKMLSILKDSESTLSKAAVQLQGQGVQIDNSLGMMDDIHSDMDIAEHLVDGLDSWFGMWKMGKQRIDVDPVLVSRSEKQDVFEYEIIYMKLEYGKANFRHVGLLRICKEGMIILTEKQVVVHHYRWSDVSQIRVVTPYEIMLIRFQIGKPDLTYTVVGADMVAILKLLDKCAKYKLKYDTPPETLLCTRHGQTRPRCVGRTKTADTEQTKSRDVLVPLQVQCQLDQSEQIVSEAEANEISRTLSGLKSLAVAVQQEGSSQNEKLDTLRESVDSANVRLTTTEKSIKRMM